MKKKYKEKEGDLIRIPISTTQHVYGRVLIDGTCAIYDFKSDKEEDNYDEVLNAPVLFTAWIHYYAINEANWKFVKNIPLEGALKGFWPRYFNTGVGDDRLGFYKVYKAEIEDAIKKDWIKTGKIQLDGIYHPNHLIDRINDYYDGIRHLQNFHEIHGFKTIQRIPFDEKTGSSI